MTRDGGSRPLPDLQIEDLDISFCRFGEGV
jgi:hypothetical protein